MVASSALKDPKNIMGNIIAQHVNNLPRTHSGKGWFLAAGVIPAFIENIMTELFSPSGIAVFYFSPDVTPLYWLFLNKRFAADQDSAQAMMDVAGFGGLRDIRKIIVDAIQALPTAGGWFNRRISNDKEKERFLSRIIDESFKKENNLAVDTVQNFLEFLLAELVKARRKKTSVQDQVDLIVAGLKKKYKHAA